MLEKKDIKSSPSTHVFMHIHPDLRFFLFFFPAYSFKSIGIYIICAVYYIRKGIWNRKNIKIKIKTFAALN